MNCKSRKYLINSNPSYARFNVSTKIEAEAILRDAIRQGNILEIIEDGISAMGNPKFKYYIDAGKVIGARGEHVIEIILSSDGAMLSAFPIKWPR